AAKNAYVAGEVKVWDAQTGQELLSLKGHTSRDINVAYSPDGKRLASSAIGFGGRGGAPPAAGGGKVGDSQAGQELLSLKGSVCSVAFSPDGKRLAGTSDDKTVKVWDAQTGQELLTCKGHTGRVSSVAFSPDGKRLASCSIVFSRGGGAPGEVKVW